MYKSTDESDEIHDVIQRTNRQDVTTLSVSVMTILIHLIIWITGKM